VTRKADGTERSGRGTAPSAAGGFGGADTALTRLARPFVPKPFRSTGGMSASADTMSSISMGRHNVDEEMPEDQINIGSIVSRKTSDRRYLPRKLGNMKRYLHTTPLNETLELTNDEIGERYKLFEFSLDDIKDFGKRMLSVARGEDASDVEKAAFGAGTALIPFAGDIYRGYLAFNNVEDINKAVKDLEEMLKGETERIDLYASPAENDEKMQKGELDLSLRLPGDRAVIKEWLIRVSTLCVEFLSNTFAAIPLEAIGLGMLDSVLDTILSSVTSLGSTFDPEGEKTSSAFYGQALELSGVLSSAESALGKVIPGKDFAELHRISNLIGNLALIYTRIVSLEQESASPDDSMPLAEKRNRKKRRKTDEISGSGSVAGYAGPLAGPKDPKKFYNTMAKVAGSEYLVDPAKTLRPKP
jgi:hypothetical protein